MDSKLVVDQFNRYSQDNTKVGAILAKCRFLFRVLLRFSCRIF